MTITETLLELEERMWQANREGDAAFWAQYLRDDAFGVSKYGTLDKAQAVSLAAANENPYLKTELSEQRVIQLDDDNAIVTYRVDVTALVQGNEMQLPAYASTVWNRSGGEWRAVFFQHTAL
ncbi:uncharacterized protein DUF4440 [Kribbella sp. VKM Ac-2527]|uniref:Uncharacterized protein DUF4440 n=1 Tax=Kribbella caucasensis TaxID=2512215 RepID=A0A4R6KI97_9ACTN|nr:nuclear transport factor 2 family protein [Kribbella sp. VKM Ac-2527]TDO49992.1 uncharacterized protein DUF4440 [Kribbella sp. VKM Ac-2527]